MFNSKQILIVSSDVIGDKMAGPAIRYYQMALVLSKTNDVTLLIPNEVTSFSELNMMKLSRKTLKKCMENAEIVIIQGMTLFKYSFLKQFKGSLIIDLYDPTMLEMLEVRNNKFEFNIDLEIVKEQLRYGDYFICASEKQKDLWIGMLLAIGRILPNDYIHDKKLNHLIGIVPFGIEKREPTKSFNPYKKFPDINEEDKILLWGGGIWDWLDPFTLIEAMNIIVKNRSDIKVVFMGTKHPTQNALQMKVADDALLLAEKYGLLGKYVHFNDWVAYAERDQYLLHAFAGVSFHINHLETKYSFRTRILDYIWCELPMILTEGDLLGDIINNKACGITVKEKNKHVLVDAILKLANDKNLYRAYKNNLSLLKQQYYWDAALEDLLTYCVNPNKIFSRKNEFVTKSNFLKIKYYGSKLKYLFSKDGRYKIYKKIIN